MNEKNNIRLKDKYCLNIEEAAAYFSIGQKKLRQLVSEHGEDFAIQNGVKVLIKRKRFEKFLKHTTSI